MTITIERSPIDVAAFKSQTSYDTEYFRKYKPDGSRYTNDDDIGHYNYHLGYDYHRGSHPDTLYAVCDGVVEWASAGSAFGKQIFLRTKASGYKQAAFYAHCETRIANGTHVLAGRSIGRMGTSGGVPEHLHFSWLADWTQHNTWRNAGPALRALQYRLNHPSNPVPKPPEVDMTEAEWERMDKLITEKVQRAAAFILTGTWSDDFPTAVPWINRDDYANIKLMEKLNQIQP